MSNKLSKSKFCNALICPKRLWLSEHKPKLAQPVSDFQQWLGEQGDEVEGYAKQYFPNGIDVAAQADSRQDRLLLTSTLIEKGCHTLYQAAFVYDEVLIYCDILRRNPDGSYALFEVKSFTDFNKYVKTDDPTNFYLNDLCIQSYVLKNNNVRLARVALMYLNRDYIRGSSLDVEQLFCFWNLPAEHVQDVGRVRQAVESLKQILAEQVEPQRELGSYCKKPIDCVFQKYCLSQCPDESLYRYSGQKLRYTKKYDLINDGQSSIPEVDLKNPAIENIAAQLQAEQTKTILVEQSVLREYLSEFTYPLYFLDFETTQYAIPKYHNNKPYVNLPFQYSLHIQEKPGAPLQHVEFFWRQKSDPSEACAQQLGEDLGAKGTIVTYSHFEKTLFKLLAKKIPHCADKLMQNSHRIIDLSIPFSQGFCYLPGSYGYSSIKIILPLIDKTMDYASLDIGSGDSAMSQYQEMLNTHERKIKESIERSLREYCGQDTLAMVKIYDWLEMQSKK